MTGLLVAAYLTAGVVSAAVAWRAVYALLSLADTVPRLGGSDIATLVVTALLWPVMLPAWLLVAYRPKARRRARHDGDIRRQARAARSHPIPVPELIRPIDRQESRP